MVPLDAPEERRPQRTRQYIWLAAALLLHFFGMLYWRSRMSGDIELFLWRLKAGEYCQMQLILLLALSLVYVQAEKYNPGFRTFWPIVILVLSGLALLTFHLFYDPMTAALPDGERYWRANLADPGISLLIMGALSAEGVLLLICGRKLVNPRSRSFPS